MQGEKHSIQHQRFQQLVPKELVRKAQGGDMHAHSEIYKMFSRAIFTLAFGICRNKHCAEDVLHNTFIKLIDKVATFENRAPFGMWLRQIAVNESLMYIRKQKKHSAVLSTDEYEFFDESRFQNDSSPYFTACQDFTDHHSDKNELNKVLLKLPEHVRLVLWLKEAEGYTHDEIAKLVNKTPSYSKTLIARTYKYLRDHLSQPTSTPQTGNH
jgi:RNA polymerase sigma-70 factor (ECF subfamily)